MPAIAVSRTIALTIGADTQSWGDSVASYSIGRESIAKRGVLAATGTITINADTAAPESVNPLENPTRWRWGQPLALQINNDSGTLTDHPLGHLFIVGDVSYDAEAQTLSVPVGDYLAWADSREPSSDDSGITLCDTNGVDLATVATRYLEAAGIPSDNINLVTFGTEIAYPIAKGSDSYVSFAGAIAYSMGYQLYVDSAGVVRAKELDTAPGTADLTITLGSNEVRYLPQPDAPREPGVVKVVGKGRDASLIQNPASSITSDEISEVFKLESYESTSNYTFGWGGGGGGFTISGSGDLIIFTKRERLRQNKDTLIDGAESSAKIVANDRTEYRIYENQGTCEYRLSLIYSKTDAAQSARYEQSSSRALAHDRRATAGVYRRHHQAHNAARGSPPLLRRIPAGRAPDGRALIRSVCALYVLPGFARSF